LTKFSADWFRRYWPGLPAVQGNLDASLSFSDQVGQPFHAELGVNAQSILLSVTEIHPRDIRHQFAFHNLQARVLVDANKATVSGGLELGNQGALDIDLMLADFTSSKKLSGSIALSDFDLRALAGLIPDIDGIEGVLASQLKFSGSLSDPLVSGDWTLKNGLLDTVQLPEPIKEIDLAGQFIDTHMAFAGDFISTGGKATVDVWLDWKDRWQMETRLHSKEILLAPAQGIRLDVQPDLLVRVSEGNVSVSGTVSVPSGKIELIELPPDAKSVSDDVIIVKEGVNNGAKWKLNTDVQVRLGKNVKFTGFGVNTFIDGAVQIDQSAQRLFASGELISREGTFSFLGQKLEVREGRIIFNGAIDDPDIYIEAVRKIEAENLTAGVRLTGKASEPRLEVFSDPVMEETVALHYIMTGHKPTPGSTYGAGIAGNLLLDRVGASNNWFSENLVGKLGVTDFQISTQSAEEGASVQLSGYLSPNLYLQYGVKLFDEVNTLSLRYRLRSNLFLEAMTGLDSSLDIIYSFEIK
jgi:translocation and assembly module TamB